MKDLDLSACEREPIHIPGSIQPRGALIAVSPELTITHSSTNAAAVLKFGRSEILGLELAQVVGVADAAAVAVKLEHLQPEPVRIAGLHRDGAKVAVLAHRYLDRQILEFEPADGISLPQVQAVLRKFRAGVEASPTVVGICEVAAREIREFTGFDRVLVYQFDPEWHGHVIAEDNHPQTDSYLDLWFPATDIPAQARELYRLNRVRLISDAGYSPVALRALDPDAGPLDLSYATLRSVSPVHVEYLKNMKVQASMSVSIIRGGKLWGLIACHHRQPKFVSFDSRAVCDLIAGLLADQVGAKQRTGGYEQRIELKSIQTSLLEAMAQEANFIDGLVSHPDELLRFANADGAAVVFEGHCTLLGTTPPEPVVRRLVAWLVAQGREDIFHTNCMTQTMPGAEEFRERASGVLAISISKLFGSYVLWFRPEVIQTVKWAGNPRQAGSMDPEASRLHPRRSFEAWKEVGRGCSLAWSRAELEGAADLRNSIVGIVLRKAEEMATLSAELQRSNKELESFSYSVSHDLRAPFRHIVGYAELLKESKTATLAAEDRRYLDVIIESAYFAGDLVDHLLNYSRIGRARLTSGRVDMKALVEEVIRESRSLAEGRRIEWRVNALPAVHGDPTLLRVVWQNLIGNAVKYTRGRENARIEIDASARPRDIAFSVKDNGAGFDPRYSGKLFGVFQRLHRTEEFEGTGIGLANVRRIVNRHGGQVWAEGQPDAGAAFYFTIPLHKTDEPSEKQ